MRHDLVLALSPVAVLLLALVVFCLIDLARRPASRQLPWYGWAILCLAFIPWGAVVYLIVGRGPRRGNPAPSAQTAATPQAVAPTLPWAAPPIAPGRPVLPSDPAGEFALRTAALVCEFDGGVGVRGVDLAVPARGVYGLVGPNGAGKTTLLRLVSGLQRPQSGLIETGVARSRCALCPDVAEFEPWLTALETVLLSRELALGAEDRAGAGQRARDTLARVGLTEAADRKVGDFSRGMTQRLGVAVALISEPDLLILDEPTSALDPPGRDDALALIAELGRDIAVLMSSHLLRDVQQVAAVVGVMSAGQLLYQGSTQQLIDAYLTPEWELRVQGASDELAATVRSQPWVRGVTASPNGALRVATDDVEVSGRRLAALVAGSQATLVSLTAVDADLESAFRALTHRASPPARLPANVRPLATAAGARR